MAEPSFEPLPDPNPAEIRELFADGEVEYRRHVAREQARDRYQREKAADGFRPFSLAKNLAEYADDGIPEPVWLVDKLCEEGANVLIQGDAKAGKSTLQMEALRCLAEKEPLFGTYTTRFTEGRIAYVDLEMGQSKTLQRLTKVNMSRAAMERIMPVSLAGLGFSIMSDLAYENLVRECLGNDIRIAVFDPLMHIAAKESENDNAETQRIVDRLNRLKVDTGIQTIFAPAHTAKGGAAKPGEPLSVRGASVWNGWAGHLWNAYYVEETQDRWFKLGASREMPPDDDALHKARVVRMNADHTLRLDSASAAAARSSSLTYAHLDRAILTAAKAQPGGGTNTIYDMVKGVEKNKKIVTDRMNVLADNLDLAVDKSSRQYKWYVYAEAPWNTGALIPNP